MGKIPSDNEFDNLIHNYIKNDNIFIFSIKKITNLFWEVVDRLSYNNDRIAKAYEGYIGKGYKNEYETFNLTNGSKALHIGCGAYPLTEITLAKELKINVVGIDKNKNAVDLARNIVKRKNLEEKIKIEHANGTIFPVDGYDLIIISSCALPKLQILDHIFKKAKKPSRIIVRELDIALTTVSKFIKQYKDIEFEKITHSKPGSTVLSFGWTAMYLKKTN